MDELVPEVVGAEERLKRPHVSHAPVDDGEAAGRLIHFGEINSSFPELGQQRTQLALVDLLLDHLHGVIVGEAEDARHDAPSAHPVDAGLVEVSERFGLLHPCPSQAGVVRSTSSSVVTPSATFITPAARSSARP